MVHHLQWTQQSQGCLKLEHPSLYLCRNMRVCRHGLAHSYPGDHRRESVGEGLSEVLHRLPRPLRCLPSAPSAESMVSRTSTRCCHRGDCLGCGSPWALAGMASWFVVLRKSSVCHRSHYLVSPQHPLLNLLYLITCKRAFESSSMNYQAPILTRPHASC